MNITDSKCYETTNGTTLTGTVTTKAGDYILATITVRSALSLPSGWQLLYTSPVISSNQTMSFATMKTKSAGTVSITVTQAVTGRIYINLISISGILDIRVADELETVSTTESTPVSVPDKTQGDVLIWGCTAYLWTTSSPYPNWQVSPSDLTIVSLPTSTQGRQANFIDDGSGSVGNRVFTPAASTAYVVAAVRLYSSYEISGSVVYGPYSLNAITEYYGSFLTFDADMPEDTQVLVKTAVTRDTIPPSEYESVSSILSNGVVMNGVASADSVYNADVADNAFATNDTLFWRSTTNTSDHWIKYDFGSGNAQVVRRFYVRSSYNLDMGTLDSYLFQGSNDDSVWDDLDSGGVTDIYTTYLERSLDNDTTYRYYRFYVTGTKATDNRIVIHSLKMFTEKSTDSVEIPGLKKNENLNSKYLWIKVELSTSDTRFSPKLKKLDISIYDTNDKYVTLLIMNPLKRFHKVEGNLTVSYDATVGTLAGLGGPVASFEEQFTPDGLLKKPNPNDEENIEISDINASGNLIRIYYTDSKSDERIEVSDIKATGVLTHINDL